MQTPLEYVGLNGPRRRYTTLESWREFVATRDVPKPKLLSAVERTHLSLEERLADCTARRRFHAQCRPLLTPDMTAAHKQLLSQAWDNLESGYGAKIGGAVDGDATLGKTTTVAELGKRFEIRMAAEHPVCDPGHCHLAIPVIYITLSPRATPKSLNVALCRFLQIPLPGPDKMGKISTLDLSHALVDAVARHGTQMVIVDDLHFLRFRDRNSQRKSMAYDANDHLKYLANILDVTFIYAGIGLESSGLFDEGAVLSTSAAQTGGRFIRCEMRRFQNGSRSWFTLLNSLEDTLVLDKLAPGTLRDNSSYLYRRTQGSIGALVTLVRKAANLAVGRSETLTKETFDLIQLPRNAESHWNRDDNDKKEST